MSGVNHEHKLVFIHVPKTAGSSISQTNLVGKCQGHATANYYLGDGDSTEDVEGYFSFGFVRNPYARLVSIYHAANQHERDWPKIKGMSFADFVCRLQGDLKLVHPHCQPQTVFLCDKQGKVLVDFVGRFETLQRDFNQICKQLDTPEEEIPVTNQSDHLKWPTYYTAALCRIVNKIYSSDFETFGYTKLYEGKGK